MADITWIKLRTNMFDDEKIKLIERMPEGDSILITWVKLLAYAGKVNCNGYIMINENIPMNVEQISIIFNRPFEKIKYAISILQGFGMLDVTEDEIITITNWDKHQNVEGMDKIRAQNRERKRLERERKKTLLLNNSNNEESHVTVTKSHATDIEKEKEKEKDIKHIPELVQDIEIKFNEFWELYRKKGGRKKSLEKFTKLLKKHSFEEIMEHTKKYMDYLYEKNGNFEYQKHCETFLNNFDLEDVFIVDKKINYKQAEYKPWEEDLYGEERNSVNNVNYNAQLQI